MRNKVSLKYRKKSPKKKTKKPKKENKKAKKRKQKSPKRKTEKSPKRKPFFHANPLKFKYLLVGQIASHISEHHSFPGFRSRDDIWSPHKRNIATDLTP